MKRWIETWKKAGPELERIREEEVMQADTCDSIRAFTGLALENAKSFPPGPTSGLVEQQRLFRLLAEKQGPPRG